MTRYPIASLILKTIGYFLLIFFVGMLYWSNTLQEEHLIRIRSDLGQIKYDLLENRESLQGLKRQLESTRIEKTEVKKEEARAPSLYPNLLQVDPFMEKTLATLLPKGFIPQGTFQRATYGKPDKLLPFTAWAETNAWLALCSVTTGRLFVGVYEKFAPYMALSIEERPIPGKDYPEFYVRLREGVYFEPLEKRFFPSLTLADHFLKRHQVTAADFKFYFDTLMNPNNQEPGATALRTYLGEIEEIKVIDPLTFTVRWRAHPVTGPDGKVTEKIKYIARMWTAALAPLPRFIYQYFADGTKIIENDSDPDTYRKNTVFAQNFSRHFAKNIIPSCGPWIFDGMTDSEIKFRRNPSFFETNAALAGGITVSFRNSPDSVWQDFKAGLFDSQVLTPEQEVEYSEFLKSPQYLEQKAKGQAIKELNYLARQYTWIGWNQENVLFKSRKTRRALTQAIDRNRLIKDYLAGRAIPIHGPFFAASDIVDKNIKPWPYDPLRAKKLLQEEGWNLGSDGILQKIIDGKTVKFSFAITYFVKNTTTKATAEFIADSLKKIGIDCRLRGIDIADLALALDDKSFDAVIMAWQLGTPPDDPRQVWHSSQAHLRSSSNVVAFANPEADKIIEALDFEYDPQKRIELYHRFDAIMHEEQPTTFLYTPIVKFLYRERLQNVFLPIDRKDLIPDANVGEPDPGIFWLKER